MTPLNSQRGFTLVELIMVIVVMGIIAGMVSVFMKSPIDAYVASGQRAALTDVADTVVRRMARDIQRALPNSINTSGDNHCVEFIPTKTGGRYRTQDKGAGDGTSLDFSKADDFFNMLGSNNAMLPDQRIVAGDVIAVYNLGPGMVDAYQQDNTASVVAPSPVDPASAPGETTIKISSTLTPGSNMLFPLASGSNRFHVISKDEKVVAYVCSNGNLYRIAANTLAHICPAAVTNLSPSITGASMMARKVTCNFDYNNSVDLQRNALVSMVLTIQDSSSTETVSLQHEVHVSNTP